MKWALLGALSLILAGAAIFIYQHRSKEITQVDDLPRLEQRVSVNADKVLSGFDQVCTELHLPAMTPIVLPLKFKLDADEYGIGPGPTVKLSDSASYQFTFLQSDVSLTAFFDNQLFDSLYESDAPYYDKPDKPKWTKDQAIQSGGSFLKVLSAQIKIKLGDAGARFDQKYQNSKYHVGEWMMWWPRVDSKGHVFSDDGVIMEMAEDHSPVNIQVRQTTSYSEEKGEPMTMEQALKRVRSKIASDIFWDRLESVFPWHEPGGWIDTKPTGWYLQIVCPGHKKNVPARLAWVFWFHMHPWEMIENPPHPPVHFHYPISLWIDAYTGSLIGGDVVGLDTPD